MEKGRLKARIDGYVYLEIAGRIQINRYEAVGDELRILGFQSIDANFEFDDRTAEGVREKRSALIISSKVIRTGRGFETHCVLDIY